MIIIADENTKDIFNNTYNNTACHSAKYFNKDEYDKAVEYTYKTLSKLYSKSIQIISYEFTLYKSLEEIEQIENDILQFDYNDSYKLATLKNKTNLIACDLVVFKRKIGLQFSFFNRQTNNYEDVIFTEYSLDSIKDTSLFLDMKKNLEIFMEQDIDYDIYLKSCDIKI